MPEFDLRNSAPRHGRIYAKKNREIYPINAVFANL
jgi:hypothetical protein